MNILSFKTFYFEIRKVHDGYYLIEKTISNYVHITLIMFCFLCCMGNWLWLIILPLCIYVVSMMLKNCIFVRIYHTFPKKEYQMQLSGSKYSFKEPKTYLVLKNKERSHPLERTDS